MLMGFYIEKTSDQLPKFKNQYYLEDTDLEAADLFVNAFVEFERQIFSTKVTFVKYHIWVPNADPRQFIDRDISGVGLVSATTPIPPQECLRVNFDAAIGFGGYKDYRVHVDDAAVTGDQFTTTYLELVTDALSDHSALLNRLRTRTGTEFQSFAAESQLQFRQLSKRWYNRNQ